MNKQEEIEKITDELESVFPTLLTVDRKKIATKLYYANYRKAPELEARIRELETQWDELGHHIEVMAEIYGKESKYQQILDKMTELMGEQERVCEWKEEKSKIDGVYYYRTNCCTMTDRKPHESNFICPYCRKPIKIKGEENSVKNITKFLLHGYGDKRTPNDQ